MGLEERQASLENEMHTAKDTIWRLTNRVVHLEKEVKTLKTLFQTSNSRRSVKHRKPVTATKSKSAKLAEIARRKQQMSDYRKSISSSVTYNDSTQKEQVVVKEENISEGSVGLMSDDENCDPHFPHIGTEGATSSVMNVSDGNMRRLPGVGPISKVESDSNTSDSDSDGLDEFDSSLPAESFNAASSSSRNKSKIWNHFHTKTVRSTDGLRDRLLAICKHCGHQVSPKSDRLRNHIRKCLSSTKPAADITWEALDTTLDASIEDLEASYLMEMGADSNHALDKETIETALSQSSSKMENSGIGRRKGPVWEHFATVTTVKSNGQLRLHAICRKCKKEVSPKSDRLRNHVIKCSIIRIDPMGHRKSKPESNIQVRASEVTAEEVVAVKTNTFATVESMMGASTSNNSVVHHQEVQENMDLETEKEGDESLGKIDQLNDSSRLGNRKGPVWQHFSTNTRQTEEGHTRITVVCNHCKKEISPKSDHLKIHIEKDHGIMIPLT